MNFLKKMVEDKRRRALIDALQGIEMASRKPLPISAIMTLRKLEEVEVINFHEAHYCKYADKIFLFGFFRKIRLGGITDSYFLTGPSKHSEHVMVISDSDENFSADAIFAFDIDEEKNIAVLEKSECLMLVENNLF